MNAVIIYDEPSFAVKARTRLENAAQRAHRAEAVKWQVKPWCLEILMLSPAMSAQAQAEAADAHLIVLALRPPGVLAKWLQDWLEQWAACRQVQNAAVAVWGGGKDNILSNSAAPDFSEFALRHGLSFVYDYAPTEAPPPVISPCRPKAGARNRKATNLWPTLRLGEEREVIAC